MPVSVADGGAARPGHRGPELCGPATSIRRPARYDVFDDTRSQVYRGIEGERATTNALIDAEPGAVIRYGTKVIKAFFFSTGGGATENNEYVFVSSNGTPGTSKVAYLRGIVDRSPAGDAVRRRGALLRLERPAA